MTEHLPSPTSSEIIIQTKLINVAFELEQWLKEKDSDSISAQNRSKYHLSEASTDLSESIYDALKSGMFINLTIGREAVKTHTLNKGAYDFVAVDPGKEFQPGEHITLKYDSTVINHQDKTRTTFYGDYVNMLDLSDIAEAISSGSMFDVVRQES